MNNRTQIIMQEIDHQNNQKIEHVISKEKSRLLNFIRQRTPTLEVGIYIISLTGLLSV